MEWNRDEAADIRRAEVALERIRKSLKARGKWWAMWRIQDVQHELQTVKREVADRSSSSGPGLGRITQRVDARQRPPTTVKIPATAGISSGGEEI